jgi:hypothetical protein
VEIVQGVPVAPDFPPLYFSIGASRWRIFWALAYLSNVVALALIWLLNMCAPLTLEWLELSGPVLAFQLSEDQLTIFESAHCCDLPLPWYPFRQIHSFNPSQIESVDVYVQVVHVNVILVGGGACCSSPIIIPEADDLPFIAERASQPPALPDCAQCLAQPLMLRCSGAVRDQTTQAADYRRCFLGAVALTPGGLRTRVNLSRLVHRQQTVFELFEVRDRVRGRLREMDCTRVVTSV